MERGWDEPAPGAMGFGFFLKSHPRLGPFGMGLGWQMSPEHPSAHRETNYQAKILGNKILHFSLNTGICTDLISNPRISAIKKPAPTYRINVTSFLNWFNRKKTQFSAPLCIVFAAGGALPLLPQTVRGRVAHVGRYCVPAGTRVYPHTQRWLLGWAEIRRFSQLEGARAGFPLSEQLGRGRRPQSSPVP